MDRGEDGGIAAAKAGHPVLMTSAGHGFYFDYYQSDQVLEPTAFGAYFPIDRVYNYDPVPAALRGTGRGSSLMRTQGSSQLPTIIVACLFSMAEGKSCTSDCMA